MEILEDEEQEILSSFSGENFFYLQISHSGKIKRKFFFLSMKNLVLKPVHHHATSSTENLHDRDRSLLFFVVFC